MKKIVYLLLLWAVTLTSCSGYQKLLKSNDNDLKYEKALEYFQEEDYTRSLALLEQLIYILRGSDKGEEAYYHYAYCHFNQKDYILAGYYFRNFITQYPRSQYVQECAFNAAYCYYNDSPRSSLDQTSTRQAISAFQLFLSRYPTSPKVDEANQLIDELRFKLETKSFNNAKLYYNLGDYLAATYALKGSLKEFPDSYYREETMYYIVKSHYEYASKSIESKQEERYVQAIKTYDDFVNEFPDSKYMKELGKINENCQKNIAEINSK